MQPCGKQAARRRDIVRNFFGERDWCLIKFLTVFSKSLQG